MFQSPEFHCSRPRQWSDGTMSRRNHLRSTGSNLRIRCVRMIHVTIDRRRYIERSVPPSGTVLCTQDTWLTNGTVRIQCNYFPIGNRNPQDRESSNCISNSGHTWRANNVHSSEVKTNGMFRFVSTLEEELITFLVIWRPPKNAEDCLLFLTKGREPSIDERLCPP